MGQTFTPPIFLSWGCWSSRLNWGNLGKLWGSRDLQPLSQLTLTPQRPEVVRHGQFFHRTLLINIPAWSTHHSGTITTRIEQQFSLQVQGHALTIIIGQRSDQHKHRRVIWSSALYHAASTTPSRFQVLQVLTPRCCNLIVVDWPPSWYQHILCIVFPALYAQIPVRYQIIPDVLPLDYCATVDSDHQVLYTNMHLSYLKSVYEGILQFPVSKLLQLWIGHHLHILHLKYICWIFTIFSSSTIGIGLLWIGHTTCIPNHSTLPQQIHLPNIDDTNRLFDLKPPIWGQEKKWMAKKSWLVMRPDPKAGFRPETGGYLTQPLNEPIRKRLSR